MKLAVAAAGRTRTIKSAAVFALGLFAVGLQLLAQQPPAPESAPLPVELKLSDLPEGARDVSDQVEVTVSGEFRSTSKSAHSAAVVVRNISDEDLSGPLVIVIDETGIASLKVEKSDGQLPADDKPYVDILDKRGVLKSGAALRAQKVEFSTPAALTLDERRQFSLTTRVLYLPEESRTAAADSEDEENIPGKSYSERQFDKVASIQERWTIPLMQRGEGLVFGTAVSENSDGELVVRVYTQRPGVAEMLPETVDGVPVEVMAISEPFAIDIETTQTIYKNGRPEIGIGRDGIAGNRDSFDAIPDGADQKNRAATERPLPVIDDPTQRYPRPIPMGVSIANADRLFFNVAPPAPFCYSGTAGCRCVDTLGTQYILTNAHVAGGLITPAGGPIGLITGFIGDEIVQPGTGDAGLCPFDITNPAQVAFIRAIVQQDRIGVLVDIESTVTVQPAIAISGAAPINIMDAALVELDADMGDFMVPEGSYGSLQRTPLDRPRLGTAVQKYGRTTINTNGSITGLNVAAIVSDGLSGRVGFYIKQIEVANLAAFGHPFSQGGDSGSLIITHNPGDPTDRQPVALLFAGGPSGAVDATLANPIGPILARFNIQIDDGNGPVEAGHSGTMGGALAPLDPPSNLK